MRCLGTSPALRRRLRVCPRARGRDVCPAAELLAEVVQFMVHVLGQRDLLAVALIDSTRKSSSLERWASMSLEVEAKDEGCGDK
jgi:hypothetical protein